MAERPRGMELIVAGDLNVDLEKAGGQGQDEEIATSVATAVLEDLSGYFLPRRRAWINDRRTWAVVRQGGVVRSRMEYILGSNLRIFQNVDVWDLRHNYDHLIVMGCLRVYSSRKRSN